MTSNLTKLISEDLKFLREVYGTSSAIQKPYWLTRDGKLHPIRATHQNDAYRLFRMAGYSAMRKLGAMPCFTYEDKEENEQEFWYAYVRTPTKEQLETIKGSGKKPIRFDWSAGAGEMD